MLRTAAERYARIKTLSGEHPIKRLCATLEVSRSGYYVWRRAEPSLRTQSDRLLREQIQAVHARSRQTYGSPRITAALRAGGCAVGRHRVARLMRSAGLYGRQKARYRVRTTDSRHQEPIAPNRLVRQLPPQRPD